MVVGRRTGGWLSVHKEGKGGDPVNIWRTGPQRSDEGGQSEKKVRVTSTSPNTCQRLRAKGGWGSKRNDLKKKKKKPRKSDSTFVGSGHTLDKGQKGSCTGTCNYRPSEEKSDCSTKERTGRSCGTVEGECSRYGEKIRKQSHHLSR